MKVINYSKIIRGEFHMKPSSTRLFIIFNLIFICLLFISPHHATAQVYYCGDINATGFDVDEKTKIYNSTKFKAGKFKIQLNLSDKSIVMKRELSRTTDTYTCVNPINLKNILSCQWATYHFNLNLQNGRYVFFKGHGYVSGPSDSLVVSYGTCDEF